MRQPVKAVLLEHQLTRRMIQVQAVALLLFFSIVVFPLGIYPALNFVGSSRPLDPANATIFAEALRANPDGTGRVEMTPALRDLVRQHPEAWFIAGNDAGVVASYGEMPPYYRQLAGSISAFDTVIVRTRPESGLSGLHLDRHESALGPITVATGGGRTIGVISLVAAFWALLSLSLLAMLSVAAAIIIPRVIRGELRGIKQAAEQAKLIDIDAGGTRLPTENVPEEVRALVDAVNDGLTRLDKSYAQRERFLADSAHELRTPIAILQTRLETAAPFPERSRLLIDVARLSSLADQLLDLQRLDLGDTAMAPLDLVDLAENVVGDLAPLAINAGYEIELQRPDCAVIVRGDEGSLSRALANLIQNAIVHGSNHGRISVAVSGTGALSVTDEGPGIKASDRERIFEPFYRVKPLARGAGLGLNLVASIIQRHQGRVAVTESDTGGARFVMYLPLEPAKAPS